VESASSIPFSATENDNIDPEISADSTRTFFPGLFCKEFFVGSHIVPAVDSEHLLVFIQQFQQFRPTESAFVELLQRVKAGAFKAKSFALVDFAGQDLVFHRWVDVNLWYSDGNVRSILCVIIVLIILESLA
jgi:hypothetical protein